MLGPGEDPTYDPRMDQLPPYDPPKRHWYDRLPTDVMWAMLAFLLVSLILTVSSMIFPNVIWLVLTFVNLGWYFVYLWKRSRR